MRQPAPSGRLIRIDVESDSEGASEPVFAPAEVDRTDEILANAAPGVHFS